MKLEDWLTLAQADDDAALVRRLLRELDKHPEARGETLCAVIAAVRLDQLTKAPA